MPSVIEIKIGANSPNIYFNNIIDDILTSNESNENINRLIIKYKNSNAVIFQPYWLWKIETKQLNNNEIDILKDLIKNRLIYYFNNKYINYFGCK